MTSLEQKLQLLNLAAMSHQIEQRIAEAAAKNMSVSATLEWLADMELEARTGRAIDRRFKSSACNRAPPSMAFSSTITRAGCKPRTAFCDFSISTFCARARIWF